MEHTKMFLYCHLFSDQTKGVIKTIKCPMDNFSIHLIDFKVRIAKLITNLPYTLTSVGKTILSGALADSVRVGQYFENKGDVFCKVEHKITPVSSMKVTPSNDDVVLNYKTLNQYSFYEANKQIVKVLVPVPGIESLPKENITSKFTETSLEVSIRGNGSNYRFAVPRLDAKIIPEKSEAFASKDGKLTIRLRKAKEDDHWTYLFKQRYVGEN